MKATDFNLANDLKFDLEKGMATFKDNRLVIFDANAIGLLRESIIKELGLAKARDLLFAFGYQNGYADFLQMKVFYKFDSEMDLLVSGPVIHTWEGIVQASPKELTFNREKRTFYFSGIWTNSYEAQQHLSYHEYADEPVCWTLMGYASGWSTAFFGSPLVAIEPFCMGKGDDHCEFVIQPPSAWGNEAKPYIDALKGLFK
ncbi:MAG: Activator of aromatic catabolism [Syntrophorhabdus sp. PtaU1.Bin050]|nr:MAG: Activator of aromatic catabolism [Syntrophorhabdus sp. PtaU1.Bin050]